MRAVSIHASAHAQYYVPTGRLDHRLVAWCIKLAIPELPSIGGVNGATTYAATDTRYGVADFHREMSYTNVS